MVDLSPDGQHPAVARAELRALSMLDAGEPLRDVLACLTSAAESISVPGAVSSILVLDEEGLLRNGASPNLPADYLDAIDRLKPHADLGTCASAAATGLVVVTPDFRDDGRWAELRHLPLALGFAGAWSQPILDEGNTVLGTFGTYFREVRKPDEREQQGVARLAKVAATAIARHTKWRQPSAAAGAQACD